jgi:hypothetical protein
MEILEIFKQIDLKKMGDSLGVNPSKMANSINRRRCIACFPPMTDLQRVV